MNEEKTYRWFILVLVCLVYFICIGWNWMGMPVLFPEIIKSIPMTHAQLGVVWGIIPLALFLFSIPMGLLCDRVGPRLIVGGGIILIGIFGFFRGIPESVVGLFISMLLFGVAVAMVFPNLPKLLAMWFPPGQLGTAIGVAVAFYTMGGATFPLLLHSVFFPSLGSWQKTIWVLGILSVIIGVIYLLTMRERKITHEAPGDREALGISIIIHKKDIWLISLSALGLYAAFIGYVGFLPKILANKGMGSKEIDGIFSIIWWSISAFSLIIPWVSDRVGLRKIFIVPLGVICGLSIVMCVFLEGVPLIVTASIYGLSVGGLFPLFLIAPIEVEGVGHKHGGAAVAVAIAIGNLGGFFASLIAGKLIDLYSPVEAFIFLGIAGVSMSIFFAFIEEAGSKMRRL